MIDLSQMINGNMQQQSFLIRKPTIQELDKFIDRVLAEKDETPYTIYQALAFKLEQQMHSPVEAETYPMIINRLGERFNK